MNNPHTQVTLGKLVGFLKKQHRDMEVPQGFNRPHSYRGYYDRVAFEPVRKPMTVEFMLAAAKGALGKTFRGYKGGDYLMDENTPVHLASYGNCYDDDEMTWGFLEELFAQAKLK